MMIFYRQKKSKLVLLQNDSLANLTATLQNQLDSTTKILKPFIQKEKDKELYQKIQNSKDKYAFLDSVYNYLYVLNHPKLQKSPGKVVLKDESLDAYYAPNHLEWTLEKINENIWLDKHKDESWNSEDSLYQERADHNDYASFSKNKKIEPLGFSNYVAYKAKKTAKVWGNPEFTRNIGEFTKNQFDDYIFDYVSQLKKEGIL